MRWLTGLLALGSAVGIVAIACGSDRPSPASYDAGADASSAAPTPPSSDGGGIVVGPDGSDCPLPIDPPFPKCGVHPDSDFAEGGAGRKNCFTARGLAFCRGCPDDGGPNVCPDECDRDTEYVVACNPRGGAPAACRAIDGYSPDYFTFCCPCQ